jgi:protein disulfide-isomerase A1
MDRKLLLAMLLAGLLISAPFIRADEEDYDDDSDEAEEKKESDDEPHVKVLTTKNWDETVGKAKYALVEFYAPWCGHCQKLKPEWSKAATTMNEHDATIIIGKVDATQEADLAQKYGVNGYPTIKWFVDGEVAMDYSGARDADGIVRWVKKKTGPAAADMADKAALTAAEKEAEVIVLGYFTEKKGDAYDAFISVAQKSEDAVFVETTKKDVAKAAGLTSAGVAVITNFEGEDRASVPLKGDVTKESIEELLKSEKLPAVIEFTDKNSQKIFSAGIEKQLLLVAKGDDLKASTKLMKGYKTAALANKGKLVFVTVNADGTSKDPVMNFFGLKEEDAPVLVAFEMAKNKKFRLREDLSEKSIAKFAKGLLDGSVQPEYKSAPIPDEPTDGGVTIVVGKNFDEIVKDKTKDVLLEVYAPWCGHCKSLEPIYKKLAKRFAKVDSVVIAKMDGTENEHADVDVKGFPTILFFPADGEKQVINFEGGDRSLKALTKFIKKNAKKSFELPKKSKKDKEDDKDEDDKEVKDEL